MSERREVKGLGGVHSLISPNIQQFVEKIEYGQEMHELVDPLNYLGEVSERVQEGYYPIFYANHTQHLNIVGFREVASRLQPRPHDLYVAIAHTLVNEGQDPKIVEFAKNLAPVLENENMHLLPVARKQDLESISGKSEEKAKTAKNDTFHNLRLLSLTMQEDAGFMFFPEATTEGAVKVGGKRKGMIEVTDSLFAWFISKSQRAGRELIFVPIGMSQTNRILEPRTSKAHIRPKFEIMKSKVSYHFGVDLGPVSRLARVVVGQPFGTKEVWEDGVGIMKNERYEFENDSKLNSYMMRRVAELLTDEEKGIYA